MADETLESPAAATETPLSQEEQNALHTRQRIRDSIDFEVFMRRARHSRLLRPNLDEGKVLATYDFDLETGEITNVKRPGDPDFEMESTQ